MHKNCVCQGILHYAMMMFGKINYLKYKCHAMFIFIYLFFQFLISYLFQNLCDHTSALDDQFDQVFPHCSTSFYKWDRLYVPLIKLCIITEKCLVSNKNMPNAVQSNNMKEKMDMLSVMTSVENKKKTEICKKKNNLLPLLDSRG